MARVVQLAVALVAAGGALAQVPGECYEQSCEIARLSGSAGQPYESDSPPKDLATDGYCCILGYNPQPRQRLYNQIPQLQNMCSNHRLFLERDTAAADAEYAPAAASDAAGCAPKTLIFAKGTTENGPIGGSVGPALKDGLDKAEPGAWDVRGVEYAADEYGNNCVGLPGGDKASQLLEQVASDCPNTQIIMSGYSQGAMVARNGVAYSNQKSNPQLKAIFTFGDPFNGAPIENFDKPIVIHCLKGDRVCGGRRIITPKHGQYDGKPAREAVQRMVDMTSG